MAIDADPDSELSDTMRRFIERSLPQCTALWLKRAAHPDLSELQQVLIGLSDPDGNQHVAQPGCLKADGWNLARMKRVSRDDLNTV